MKQHYHTLLALLALTWASSQAYAASCNPTSEATCGLPFPSNAWAVSDAQSPTGIRLAVENDVLRSDVLAQLPIDKGFSPELIFKNASGFSVASPALFEFSQQPNEKSLPKDGGNAVIAWDITTNQRIDIRTSLNGYARSKKVSAPSNVIEIFPAARWAFGHTVLVMVTHELQVDDNNTLSHRCTDGGAYCQSLLASVQSAGFNADELRNATLFTVRDRSDVLQPMRETIDTIWNSERPMRNVQTFYNIFGGDVGAWVIGELKLDNYRIDNNTGKVDFSKTPTAQWVKFKLTLPASAKYKAAPVALYAHGIIADRNTDVFLSGMNAELGIATFSINFPNHGDRAQVDGGHILQLAKTEKVGQLVGMINQNALDFAAAHKALVDNLNTLDVLSEPTWLRWCSLCPDGKADMDVNHVMMQGTSLGGVLGLTYGSLSRELKAGLFQVTGVGVINILSESVFWDLAFHKVVPSRANGAEALMLRAAIQQSLDYGDPINHADLLRNPDTVRPIRPVFISAGQGDSLVTNPSSISLARIVDVPLVGTKLFDMPRVRKLDDYDEYGFGLRHYATLTAPLNSGNLVDNALAHGIFLRTESTTDQKQWIKRYFLNQ